MVMRFMHCSLYVRHIMVIDMISLWLDYVIKQLIMFVNVTKAMFLFAISESHSCLPKIIILKKMLLRTSVEKGI